MADTTSEVSVLGPEARALWHRVESYANAAAVHRGAAREWRRVATCEVASTEAKRAYFVELAETQEALAKANQAAAEKLAAATMRLDD